MLFVTVIIVHLYMETFSSSMTINEVLQFAFYFIGSILIWALQMGPVQVKF